MLTFCRHEIEVLSLQGEKVLALLVHRQQQDITLYLHVVSHSYWNIKDPAFPGSVCTACPPNYLALKLFSAKNSVNWTFVQTAPRVDNGERFTDPLFPLFRLIHLGQVIGDGWIEADEKRMEPCSLNHHRDGCSHGSGWGAVPVARRLAGSGLEVPLLYWTTRLTLRWPRIGPWPQ